MNRNRISIGTDPMCDISVEPEFKNVSPRHAEISVDPRTAVITLTDHSDYGTVVNGIKCHNSSVTLNLGDHIVMGDSYSLPWGELLTFFPDLNPSSKAMRPSSSQGGDSVLSRYDSIHRALNKRRGSRVRTVVMVAVTLLTVIMAAALIMALFFDDIIRSIL